MPKDLPLKVINFFGGPGIRKSTTAAGVFNLLKCAGLKVELVTEVAKDLTYGKEWKKLENQLYILGVQDQRLRQLVGEVDWVVTDSPLPLGFAYLPEEYRDWLPDAILGAYERYDNYDFLLTRRSKYETYGRSQTEAQALKIDMEIRDIWQNVTCTDEMEDGTPILASQENAWEIEGTDDAPYRVVELLDIGEVNDWLAERRAADRKVVHHGGV